MSIATSKLRRFTSLPILQDGDVIWKEDALGTPATTVAARLAVEHSSIPREWTVVARARGTSLHLPRLPDAAPANTLRNLITLDASYDLRPHFFRISSDGYQRGSQGFVVMEGASP